MAEQNRAGGRGRAELVALAALMALLVAVIVVGVVRMVPGSAPLLAEGAELARPSDLLFYALAALAIASACGVAFSRNIIYSALSLLGALIGAGALYVYLKADYVAVTQLLVYIGGVLVLILFAVMLTGRIGDRSRSNPSAAVLPGVGLLAAVLGVLGFVAFKAPWQTGSKVAPDASTASRIGDLFLGEYLLAFEVVSLLLLATLIGAVVIARKEIKE